MIMELMPKEVRDRIPALYAQENAESGTQVIHVKLFDPSGRWTLYATEFDGNDTFFGYVLSPITPDYDEWGYASLREIEQTRGLLGLPMERDLWFEPIMVKDCAELSHLSVMETE